MTVFAVCDARTGAVDFLAPTKGAADTMRVMFGAARRRVRKLTAEEAATPWIQAEIAEMQERGAW